MYKKAQVTMFIILGIVIVAVVAGAIYYSGVISSFIRGEIGREIAVPEQVKDVNEYVKFCVLDVVEDGIGLLGQQGGYISLPESERGISFSNPFNSFLSLTSGYGVAYWFYETTNNIQKFQIPRLRDMELELNKYIEENVDGCLDGFSIFKDEGFNISYSSLDVESVIGKNKVLVDVNLIVDVVKDDFSFRFEEFKLDVESDLGRLYGLAKEIFEKENENNFLEERVIDMMVVYDEIPYSGTEFECKPLVWSKSKVERDFREILSRNMQFFRVKNTGYELSRDRNSYFELDALKSKASDVSVNFRYNQEWPFFMEVEPSKGDLLEGDQIIKETGVAKYLNSIVCIENYNFIYDVKFPVLVVLNSDSEVFQFAYQVIIDNNQAKENLLGAVDYAEEDTRICDSANIPVTVYALGIKGDGSLEALRGARISVKCLTTRCDVGETVVSEGDIFLSAKVPACVNAQVIASKEGYNDGKQIVSTNEGGSVNVLLEPVYELDYEIKVIDKSSGNIRGIYSGEQVVINLINEELDYSVSLSSGEGRVKLISGSYDVSAYVIEESGFPIQIAGKEIEKCVDKPRGILGFIGLTEKECSKVDVPGSILSSAVKGGVEFSWNIERGELSRANEIIFYVVSESLPSSYDDLTKIYENIGENVFDSKFKYPELR